MIGVLEGFSIIWVVILVGYLVGRTGVLGQQGRHVLSRVTFFVASPALLFTTLADSDPASVLGPMLWVAALSAALTAVAYYLVTAGLLRRPASESIIAAMSASTVNSANLGLPIALYVLGDMAYAAPIILFQLALYQPINLAMLDATTSRHRTTPIALLLATAKNPMIIGSLLGLVVALTGIELPSMVLEPIELIAGASIPAMLMAFGISLVGSKPLEKKSGRRADVLIASAAKLLVHPLLAWVLAYWVFNLRGELLVASVIMAGLPTAQNIFVTAMRYEHGVTIAKDTVLITTICAIPLMMVLAIVLGI
ncbi:MULTISPECIES: AEC family transporter [Glutamicibacter]|uniref:RHBT family transporter n=2 Tax=Glutamicibacter arilaitensis TaxID=256701 RepID=A0ABM9PZD5_GLUAR|nr:MULTISPECIES: AEC family transporter [Glutamicibacter]CBT76774.1 RHBT family transporter [Glutamicibacter arilaitensis Re117]HCH46881.1 AEC family transporter [Glutamicibacter sp.]HCJ53270.1 AEC family transporter [Glutamicibacter sp.]HCM95213.1 AEC family transporter [Glutamicibacter sp.]